MESNKLVLIDGHALAYRMFFALPINAFTTKAGEPTNATFGFIRTILDIMFDFPPPKYLAVCFDVGRTFRDDMFEDYKGTREKMPDDLALQIERIQEVLQALNIPTLSLDGYEADDVIGTLAAQAKGKVPVSIVTGDRDLLQLVDDNTLVDLPLNRNSKRPVTYNAKVVFDEYEMRPDQIIDWKALEGDSSDNIPGVRGVGRKTAVKLLSQYDTLDNIYAHLEEIPARFRNKLEAGKEMAYLSKKLATIVTDVPIELDLDACVTQDFDLNTVLDIFRELEFRSLTNQLLEHAEIEEDESVEELVEVSTTQPIIVQTKQQLDDLVKKLNAAELIAFDVETSSLDKLSAELVGISLAIKPPVGYYIPVGHISNEAQKSRGQLKLFAGEPELAAGQLPLKTVIDALRAPMTNGKIAKVAHNAKFDWMILHRHGLDVEPIRFDTMIAEWLTDPSSKHLGLKDLSRHRLGIEMQEITELIGKGKNQRTFAEVGIEAAAPYAAADADVTLRLVAPLKVELKEKGLLDLMDMETRLICVLAEMEFAGIKIDTDFFASFGKELEDRVNELEKEIYEIAGEPFNINSTQQLSVILFERMGLPTDGVKKNKSGSYSTAVGVLEKLKVMDEDGIIDRILEHREISKLKGTYVDAFPLLVADDGRIHTSFRQTGAVTGRLSSNSPNLQNIPIRSALTRRVRKGFVAQEGWHFLAADYSQVELRILAHVSDDKTLLDAFHQNLDVHTATAASVFGVDLDAVTFEQRLFAKRVNFGLMYGMGAFRLARETDLTLAEAENYIKAYFEQFPGVRDYLDGSKQLARRQGYVETLLGRRRYFPIFMREGRSNRQYEASAEREAINHPIQGTAADIIKLAMLNLDDALEKGGYRARLLLQVHDELMLEVPDDELDSVTELVKTTMRNAFKLKVPLKVEAEVGKNWLEIKG